jgi:hypothetical protein
VAIVKVSIPSTASVPDPLPLVYAKGRINMVMQTLDYATARAMGRDLKGYFEAEWDEAKQRWNIGRRVNDRDW